MVEPVEEAGRRWQGPLLIAVAAALWGTTGVAAKTLFSQGALSPQTLALVRLAIACPCFALLSRWRGEPPVSQLRPKQWLWLVVLGLTQGAYQFSYLGAVNHTGAGLATLVALCLPPVMVGLAAIPLLGERLSPGVVAAVAGAVAGTVLLVHGDHQAIPEAHRLAGILLALAAALVYAIFTLVSRHLAGGIGPFQTAFICFLVGALTLLPASLGQLGALAHLSLYQGGIVIYLGLITTCAAYICFFQGMRNTSATASSIIVTLEPLFAAILAWVLLGERLDGLGIVGAGLLTIAVLVASARRAVSLPPHRPTTSPLTPHQHQSVNTYPQRADLKCHHPNRHQDQCNTGNTIDPLGAGPQPG